MEMQHRAQTLTIERAHIHRQPESTYSTYYNAMSLDRVYKQLQSCEHYAPKYAILTQFALCVPPKKDTAASFVYIC